MDDWLVISIEADEQWATFCQATDHPEWAEDERFADQQGRHEHHDELDRLIEEWTKQQEHYQAFHLLQQAGVKAAPVLNGKEIHFDPHIKERGHFDVVDQPHQGMRPVPRHLAAKFDEFEASAQGPAPTLGQHNKEVLGGLLGLTDDELGALEEEGVIATTFKLPFPPEVISKALKLPYDRYLEAGVLRAIEPDYRQQLGLE